MHWHQFMLAHRGIELYQHFVIILEVALRFIPAQPSEMKLTDFYVKWNQLL